MQALAYFGVALMWANTYKYGRTSEKRYLMQYLAALVLTLGAICVSLVKY